jgi:RHS repeat-associated protein
MSNKSNPAPFPKLINESFTAYGLPRNPDTWSGTPSTTGDSMTRQGYTFQTVLGRLGLNHMNGRVQDAITGTFLSPDPFVPHPGNTQSFNRYAYVRNNPMSYTDPSGFWDQMAQGCDGCMFGMVGGAGSGAYAGVGYDVIQYYGGFKSWMGSMGLRVTGPDCDNSKEFCMRGWNQSQADHGGCQASCRLKV